jgi:hypothetical protein
MPADEINETPAAIVEAEPAVVEESVAAPQVEPMASIESILLVQPAAGFAPKIGNAYAIFTDPAQTQREGRARVLKILEQNTERGYLCRVRFMDTKVESERWIKRDAGQLRVVASNTDRPARRRAERTEREIVNGLKQIEVVGDPSLETKIRLVLEALPADALTAQALLRTALIDIAALNAGKPTPKPKAAKKCKGWVEPWVLLERPELKDKLIRQPMGGYTIVDESICIGEPCSVCKKPIYADSLVATLWLRVRLHQADEYGLVHYDCHGEMHARHFEAYLEDQSKLRNVIDASILSFCACKHSALEHKKDALENLLECSRENYRNGGYEACDCTHFHYAEVIDEAMIYEKLAGAESDAEAAA